MAKELHSLKDLGKHRASAPSTHTSSQGSKGLPDRYLQEGYFDEGKYLRLEYIVEYAHHIAEQLAKHPVGNDNRKHMGAAALRRFFTKVRFLQRKLDAKQDFKAIMREIRALIPYANNAQIRMVVPKLFHEFIRRNVNAVVPEELINNSQDEEALTKSEHAFREGFLKHFEYVVAFFPKSK